MLRTRLSWPRLIPISVVQRFMLCIGCREMKYGVEFYCISPSILQVGWWASFLIVGGFLVFAQCYINSRVVICLFAFMLNVFSYHFRTCVFDWRFPCYRQEKGGCFIVFLRGLLSLRFFSFIYLYLSGRLSDQILSCKFPLLIFFCSFFPLHLFRIACLSY